MESEKVKEIKKALELNEYYAIEYFPKSGEPKIFTFTDLLTLINELESENEKLAKAGKRVTEINKELSNEHKKIEEQLKDRITELEKEVETRKEEVLHLQEYGKKLIRETELKQFAERLKEKMTVHYPSVIESIDETLKEFIEC